MSKPEDVFSTNDIEVIEALIDLLSARSAAGEKPTEEEQAYFDRVIKLLYEKRGFSPVS